MSVHNFSSTLMAFCQTTLMYELLLQINTRSPFTRQTLMQPPHLFDDVCTCMCECVLVAFELFPISWLCGIFNSVVKGE